MTQNTFGSESIIWDLSDLFDSISDPNIQPLMDTSIKQSKQFQTTYKGKLSKLSPSQLNTAYDTIEKILTPLYKLVQYAHLEYAIDTSNQAIKQLVAKVDECEAEVSNNIVFFDLELGNIDKKTVNQWETDERLSNYHYTLRRSQETAQYNLEEAAEKWISTKDITGINGYRKLYSELTSSFRFKITVDNEEKELTGTEIRNLRLHKDPKVRKKAMELFFNTYKQHKITIGHIFNHILKDFNTERTKRGYSTPMSVRNIGNNLPEKTIDLLHKVTNESNELVERYYNIKKKLLKLETMTLADIYAPLPDVDQSFTYDSATSIVLESLKNFDNEFYSIAKDMVDQKRIHAPVQKNKRGGAFCSGYTPDVYPYVMLNFLGKPRDVSTFAHELGHAIHDVLANKQTLTNFHPILPLAETASVFSEMIVTDSLKKQLKTNQDKIVFLCEKLEDIFATSHRQNMFSEFEKTVHEKISKDILSTDDICSIYTEKLKAMFGNSVSITPEYSWEWAAIPHMLDVPFYVHAYNFGNLLVFALYQQYLEEGEPFIKKLKVLLSSGSSQSPVDITQAAGLDIQSEAFWTKSIDYIKGMIHELEALVPN